jgi:hypothetical protein
VGGLSGAQLLGHAPLVAGRGDVVLAEQLGVQPADAGVQ